MLVRSRLRMDTNYLLCSNIFTDVTPHTQFGPISYESLECELVDLLFVHPKCKDFGGERRLLEHSQAPKHEEEWQQWQARPRSRPCEQCKQILFNHRKQEVNVLGYRQQRWQGYCFFITPRAVHLLVWKNGVVFVARNAEQHYASHSNRWRRAAFLIWSSQPLYGSPGPDMSQGLRVFMSLRSTIHILLYNANDSTLEWERKDGAHVERGLEEANSFFFRSCKLPFSTTVRTPPILTYCSTSKEHLTVVSFLLGGEGSQGDSLTSTQRQPLEMTWLLFIVLPLGLQCQVKIVWLLRAFR